MKYFVTGGAGFIGSNYVRMLLTDQFGPVTSVKVIDKLTYAGSLDNLNTVINDPRLSFHKGDICNKSFVEPLMEEDEIVVNFAAESHVDRSIEGPSEFIRTNVLGTQVLLSAAVDKKARLFLQVSTDEVYGSITEGNSIESDQLFPNSPYSASKASADLLVRSYIKTFGLDARITRCCNNFGPNQFPEKFIPLAIENLKSGKNITIYGDGSNIREWIYVDDHCRGIQLVIQLGSSGDIYNIGSSFEISNLNLANLIVKATKMSPNRIEFVTDRKGHDFRYSLDSTLIQSELGFRIDKDLIENLNDYISNAFRQVK